VAGWMRYVRGLDDKGQKIDIVDPLFARYQAIHQQYHSAQERVRALLAIESIFGRDLPENSSFVNAVMETYVRLEQRGARAVLESLQ
ncbi:mannitol dehydrogenase family protein, partial [Klebsiella pneumoniae]